MTILDDMRVRADRARSAMVGTQEKYDQHFPIRSSARDVAALLSLVDSLAPLVQVARDFVHGDYDKDTLERLIDAADKMPWSTLDALGITEAEE